MGGGKGGSGGELPDYSQLIQDSAFYGRTPQMGPGQSLMWDTDRASSAMVLSPSERMRQGLMTGLGNTALGTLMGWYGGTPADMGQFDPATGTYQPSLDQWYTGGRSAPPRVGGPQGGDGFPAKVGEGPYNEDPGAGGGDGLPWPGNPPGAGGGGYDSSNWYDPYGDLAPGGLPNGVGGGYRGLDFGDQDFLRSLIGQFDPEGGFGGGGGGGGGSYNYSGGGGVNVGRPGTEMLTYDQNGNPTIGSALMSDLDLASLPEFASEGDLMGARDKAEQAMFKRAMGLIDPGFDQRRAQEAEMLANRGAVEGGDIWSTYGANTDQAYNQARTGAAFDAVGEGRKEYGFLSNEARTDRNMTLLERLQQAGLHNQAQAQMGAANLGARGQEWNELYGRGQLGLQGAAINAQSRAQRDALDFQRWQAGIANALQGQSQLWSQQMGERGTQYGELANLLGLGSPMGMQGYWSPQGVDVMGASQQGSNNAMTNYQMSPLGQIMGLGGSFLGAMSGF